MRVRTYLRRRRGERGFSIRRAAAITGITRGDLSKIERGYLLPTGDQAERLARVYGPIEGWYPAGVLHALDADLADRVCPGCGEQLDPDASRGRLYHGPACGSRARRTRPAAAAVV